MDPVGVEDREWSRRNHALLKHSSSFVDQAQGLLVHPFLIVIFHILFAFSPTAVHLLSRWRVMSELCVTVVTKKLGHMLCRTLSSHRNWLFLRFPAERKQVL